MKMNQTNGWMSRILLFSSILALVACGAGTATESNTKEESKPSETATAEVVPVSTTSEPLEEPAGEPEATPQQKPQLPTPELQLPELPYDKSKLPTVLKLDEMLEDDAWLETAYNLVYKEIQTLEEKTETSMSGTPEDQIKAIMTMINGVNHFNGFALPIAEMAIEKFQAKYASDAEFGEKYRDTYYAAEEEISGGVMNDGKQIIQNDVKRREVSSHFSNGYSPSRSSELRSMKELIEQSKELTETVIGSVTSQANVDMMVADYQKGTRLTDLINGTINKLNLVKTLNPEHEEVNSMLKNVEEKRKSRMEEIQKALVEYRFPERYSNGDAPSNSSSLESMMESYLSKSKRTSSQTYDVKEIKVAGPWIDIYHTLTGKHLYSQIDFYVAVPSLDDSSVLEVLFVTGKTNGPHHKSFAKYSVGGVGQMLATNL